MPPVTVAITGASSGLGRALAQIFAAEGARIGLIARGAEALAATAQDVVEAGGTACVAAADVAESAALEAAAAAIEDVLGPIGIWVNAAGNGVFARFVDTPEAEFRRVMDVTFQGTVNGTAVALRRMLPRDQGRVVNICSAVAFRGLPALASYSAAKSAVQSFSRVIRAELAHDGRAVRVLLVYPPAVNTPFFDHAACHFAASPRPARPVYQPEAVARAIRRAIARDRQEAPIGAITTLFGGAVRLVPAAVDWCIGRLGFEGQLTACAAAAARRAPSLFTGQVGRGGIRGSFDE